MAQLRGACAAAHISMSEWIRSAVINACRQSEITGHGDPMTERLSRDLTFATVALDACWRGILIPICGRGPTRPMSASWPTAARVRPRSGEAMMKRNLVNFTRGSQLLGHFGFMFAAGLKGPLLVAAVTLAGLAWWQTSSTLSDHDQYLVWMRLYAEFYGFMEFDPARQVTLETSLGGTVQLAISRIETYAPALLAWTRFMSALGVAARWGAAILIPASLPSIGSPHGSAASPRSASMNAARCWFRCPN